jgi:hypothetical protein
MLESGAPGSVPSALRSLGDSLKDLGRIETVASAIAAAGVLYIVGGIAVLVRLAQTHLPVEQGLYVVPREVLLLIGVREFLVAVVVAMAVYALSRWTSHLLWLQLVAVALVAAVVPLTFGGLIWPGALLAALVASALLGGGARAAWLPVIIVALILVATVSRYTNPPYRFPIGSVYKKGVPAATGCPRVDAQDKQPSYCGAYLSSTSDNVYIGITDRTETSYDEAEIIIIPRDGVEKVFVSSPPASRAPRTSLIGRLIDRFGPGVSCTLLECWIEERNYGARWFG